MQDERPYLTASILTREEQIQVITWLVELKTTGQIQSLIKERFNKDIARVSIWRYSQCKKWKPVIKRLRARFEKNLLKIPVANKADRLRYLQKIVEEGLTWYISGYSKENRPIYEMKIRAATEAIREARAEMEPDNRGSQVNNIFIIEQLHKLADGNGELKKDNANTNRIRKDIISDRSLEIID